jgi:hypothetical protein
MIELLDDYNQEIYNVDLQTSLLWVEDLMNELESEGFSQPRLDSLKKLSMLFPEETFRKFWIILSGFACQYSLVYNVREQWMQDPAFMKKLEKESL